MNKDYSCIDRITKYIKGDSYYYDNFPEFNKGDLIILDAINKTITALITGVHIGHHGDMIEYSILFEGEHHQRVSESTLNLWQTIPNI